MSSADSEHRRNERWRRMLLPLMTRLLLGLTIFFFTVSLAQITYLHWRVGQTPTVDLSGPVELLEKVPDALSAANTIALLRLEANALERRYHQASVVLMARVWTSYLGFVTGMILTLVGAAFTLGRVQESPTSIEAKAGEASGALQTSAPGIVLATLGAVLMIATLFVPYNITVRDYAVYSASSERVGSGSGSRSPPPLSLPDTLSASEPANPNN